MGDIIGSQNVTVNGGTIDIVEFPWVPPDPSDYSSIGADQAHFCLLARIETSPTAPFGMTSAETANLYANVQNNNNIVWKNISIVDTDGVGGRVAAVVIGNLRRDRRKIRLVFETPKQRGLSLFDWGHVLAEFVGDDLKAWAKEGIDGQGLVRLPNGLFLIAQSGAELVGRSLKVNSFGTLRLHFVPNAKLAGARVFELDVVDLDEKGHRLGGQRFLLKTTLGMQQPRWDTQLETFDGVTWARKGQRGCLCENC